MACFSLVGQTFGRLTVIGIAEKKNGHPGRVWTCRCSCGVEKKMRGDGLRSGKVLSCGCYARELNTTHGMKGTPEYVAYHDAKNRCLETTHRAYKDYGGRGIKFLFTSFEQFLAEIGPRPPGKSLDRKNNNGNYEPGNVRWATAVEQRNNRRDSQ